MAQKAKRDILELNKFQLLVLKPFYVACLLSALFFAAMCYGIFFFPQDQAVQSVILTQCTNHISSYSIIANVLSLFLSIVALVIVNRINNKAAEDTQLVTKENKILLKNDQSIAPTLFAGAGLFFSVAMILFFLYQYFGMQNLGLTANFMRNNIDLQKIIIIMAAMVIMCSIFALFYWAYKIINKVLGPYERILCELDKVVEGRSSKVLIVRDGDEMFAELIERINILIKQRKF